ncbi:limbic system-associated membrane protein-like isoform X3 [Apostichopus japonicus]
MLRISNVTPRNGGIYSHITYYDTGNADKGTFLLQVQGSPGLFNVTTDVTEGEAITAQCCVKSSMEPRLTWMVDTGIVHDNTHSLEIATVSGYRYCGQIMLTSQRIHNGKEMICEVQNGLNLSASSHLNVFYQPTINISVKGTNTCATRSCIFKEFANVTLLCSTDGNPKPNVTLTRIVKPGEFDKRKTYFTEKWSTMKSFFLFDNFTRMLYGRYRCEANNGIGDIVFDAVLLNVTFAATVNIVVSPTPDTVTPHGNFTVECEAYSNPFPTISLQKKIHEEWITLRNSVSPQTKRRLRYQAVWTLSYDEVYNDYMGIYRCMADNGIGRPAQSNTTVLYAVQDVDESSPVSRKPLLICVILFVVFGISSLTFFYNRRQIAKLSRRYSRRLHPRFDTVDFPDVVRAHHALDVENRMLHRDLPANPCKEGNVDSERPVVYDHCYEQCLGGNSGRKLSVSYQDPEDDFADGPELDINGYARLSPETASICERDDANHQVANIYIDDRVPECANSD